MTEVKFDSNFGAFAFVVTADLRLDEPEFTDTTPDGKMAGKRNEEREQAANLASLGLGAMVAGAGASMEKILLGGAKRQKEWTRTSVAYTAELAKAIQVAASVKLDEIAKEKKLPSVLFEVTGAYVSTAMEAVHNMAKNTLATLAGQPPEIVNAFGIAFGGLLASDTEEEKLAKLVAHFSKVQKA